LSILYQRFIKVRIFFLKNVVFFSENIKFLKCFFAILSLEKNISKAKFECIRNENVSHEKNNRVLFVILKYFSVQWYKFSSYLYCCLACLLGNKFKTQNLRASLLNKNVKRKYEYNKQTVQVRDLFSSSNMKINILWVAIPCISSIKWHLNTGRKYQLYLLRTKLPSLLILLFNFDIFSKDLIDFNQFMWSKVIKIIYSMMSIGYL
jgi:hypothetical protein